MLILHPGDLSAGDWLRLLVYASIFCAAPVFIIGLILYKVLIERGANNSD